MSRGKADYDTLTHVLLLSVQKRCFLVAQHLTCSISQEKNKLRSILATNVGKKDTKEIELHSKDFARANHGISSMSCLDGASSNA